MKNEEKIWHFIKDMKEQLNNGIFVEDRTGVKMVEVIDANIKDLDPYQKVLDFGKRKTPLKYVEKELKWYDSKSLNIEDYVGDIQIWNNVADEDGFVNSNYGWCIYSDENFKQYKNSLKTLVNHPESRRAVMIYNRPSMQYDFNRDGKSDFMCTQNTQQFIRDNKLKYIVNQRSQDTIFGLFNDLSWHQEVYQRFYNDLKKEFPSLEKGTINLNVGSLHIYERHFDMLRDMYLNDGQQRLDL